MSLQQTPVIADSETMETLKLAEEISTFFEDQKLKAQDRIRQCEAFINNLHLPSKSVKEGLASLRQNAEEDYSTLLHLERVLNMRDGGDFVPTLDTPIIQHNRAYLNSPLGFAGAGSSGDHLTSNIGSRLKKNARLSSGKRSSSYEDDDDGHGDGTGFTMGGELHQFNPEHDESFDSFSFDESFSSSDESISKAVKISGRTKRSSNESHQEQKDLKGATDNVPCDAEDEEEDFVEQELPQGRLISGRDPRGSKAQLAMARSLPVSVPLPEGLPKRASIFDLPSDEGDEEEESDVDDENNGSNNKKKSRRGQRPDIPRKIEQIAKSMYERDAYGFGESPQKN